ncbi:MAG: UDP-N-acetylmuramoyl-L-alanyl-D-glutamate--2,6-diaminopimelate ligase [Xanthomonadales bacterium]|nr:UDP-N-acetylmuramoyl-L-alanyl-D-glutamate--2,6-diaminopimelate ligase [Xanthomonadales bacterium]
MKPLDRILAGLVDAERVPSLAIAGLAMDSRRLAPGDAFLALAGTRRHGMEYAESALRAGATVVLHDGVAPVPEAIRERCVEVSGLAAELHTLCARYWDDPVSGLDLTAVTGTNGKSSVAWLLAQALNGGMIGTLGIGRPNALAVASHTTPDMPSLYRALAGLRDDGIGKVVLEASSHALDQQRLAGLRFGSVIFTNLERDHLDYHGTLEAYGRAKACLFTDYPSRHQLINVDDEFGRRLAGELKDSPGLVTYGLETARGPDVLGTIRRATLEGLQMDVNTPEGRVCCASRLIGRINASNIAIVIAELTVRGYNVRDIAGMIANLDPVPGRMNRIDGPAGQRVVIDYAHSPDALGNALAALRQVTGERLVCVFGCGGERDRGKRPMMGRVAESLADEVILTSDNPRGEDPLKILRDIQAGMARPDRVRVIPDRRQAIGCAVAGAGADDCVLVAGKGHEQTQDLGDSVIEFSDFDAVRSALVEAA